MHDGEALVLIDKDRFCVSFPQGGLQALVEPPQLEPEEAAALNALDASGGWESEAPSGKRAAGATSAASAAPRGNAAEPHVVVGGTGASRGIDRANAAFAEMHLGSSSRRSGGGGGGGAGRSKRY